MHKTLLILNVLLIANAWAMEIAQGELKTHAKAVVPNTPSISLAYITTHCQENNCTVSALKQEFNESKLSNKSPFYEKFIIARLGKMTHHFGNNPKLFTVYSLLLRQVLNTDQQEKDITNSLFLNKFTKSLTSTTITNAKKYPSETYLSIRSGIALTSDNILFTAGSFADRKDNIIRSWDLANGNGVMQLDEHVSVTDKEMRHEITSLKLSSKNNLLYVASRNSTIQILDVSNPKKIKQIGFIQLEGSKIPKLALSPDETTLCATCDGAVTIWDVSTPSKPTCIDELKTVDETNILTAIAISNDNTLVAAADFWRLYLWNIAAIKNFCSVFIRTNTDIANLEISSDNKTLFAGTTWNDSIEIWDICADLVKNSTISPIESTTSQTSSKPIFTALHPCQPILFSYSSKSIKMWDISKLSEPKLITTVLNSENITNLLFCSNSNMLICKQQTGSNIKIKKWDFSQLFAPSIVPFIVKLPTTTKGIIELWLIQEIMSHQHKQTHSARKPLVITNTLLKTIFEQLPKELQEECITNNYVTFKKLTYRPTRTCCCTIV